MKTLRKVYYLRYPHQKVPMIRISGKYLVQYGIEVGDDIKVEYSKDQIVITKLKNERRNHYES